MDGNVDVEEDDVDRRYASVQRGVQGGDTSRSVGRFASKGRTHEM